MRAIFVDCTPELAELIDRAKLRVPEGLEILHGRPSAETVARACAEADYLFVEHTTIPSDLIRSAPNLKGIVFMGTGFGSYIDGAVAAGKGVRIAITPGYGDQTIAEHALALMFAGSRRIAEMDADIRKGIWRPLGGRQLKGKTVAVVGLGGIGTAFARMAQAIGMDVRGWNRSPREESFYEPDLDRALAGADVVSLHLGLNDGTRGLIDARRLALPKPGFLLVNTARSGLVERAALLAALKEGRVGHAGLDVFDVEPLPQDDLLVALPNVTLTTHAAYMSDEAYATLWSMTLAQLDQLVAERG